MIRAGKRCVLCPRLLNPPYTGERFCDRCGPPRIRCYLQFEQMFDTWHVTVRRDGRTVRELKFADAAKVEEMARRGNGLKTLADGKALEVALRSGRGRCELMLTDEQWRKLCG